MSKLKVIETFSGIGAQAKALERLKIKHEIFAIADWDINAIIAYDLIHNGEQDLSKYVKMTRDEIIERLENQYTLSPDGKNPFKEGGLRRTNIEVLRRVLCAIERCNNLVSITDIKGRDIPENIDLFTYSFPCQDLSIAGVWHGNMSGIDRDAHNRSGMLWEVERILKECVENKQILPKFLLMENVRNITASRHMGNFQEWIDYLENIGYHSHIYKLNASNFGIPQIRERVYMISIFIGTDSKKRENKKIILNTYFKNHNLEDEHFARSLKFLKRKKIQDIIKNDYSRKDYKMEAKLSQLHDTPSRWKIINDNDKIIENGKFTIQNIKTITTKQDRNPNSGVVEFNYPAVGKVNYRYLTSRECFLAMGFDEEDYEILIKNNIDIAKNRKLFSEGKLIKMAGNSITVNVLEAIFNQIMEIKDLLKV